MFVRKKKNKSGLISVQVVDKSTSKYRVVKTIGSSVNALEVENYFREGQNWIKKKMGQESLDLDNEEGTFSTFISGIKQIRVVGTELLLGKIFDSIGFNMIPDVLFKQLILARLCFPVSKLKTTDLLKKYHGIDIHEDQIYRYMDKLNTTQKTHVQQISYDHTLKVLGGEMHVVFYDVTTLYFEIDQEDELRKTGFSKEGKHQNPQIVLGLLVSVDGYPLAYEIFEGNQFEGHTMLPVIDAFKKKYALKKLVIIADSGLLSAANIDSLEEKGYEFILGARIKNESKSLKEKILALKLENGQSHVIEKSEKLKLVISYSDSRAKKDRSNREKGLARLEKRVRSGKISKNNINNKGYNKYLKLEGEIKVSINMEKFQADAGWDGLKGYMSNTDLSKGEIITNYSHLWKIEKAFRIAKTDLRIRPIYHRLQKRIEAHICIAFVAYKVYKELERLLKIKRSDLSPEKAIEIAKTIYAIQVKIPSQKKVIEETLKLNEEQEYLSDLFQF